RVSTLQAAVAVAILLTPAVASAAGGAKRANVGASVTMLQPVSVSVVLNLSSGAVKTSGNSPTGTVAVPASYPVLTNPQPTYVNASAQNGANAAAPNAAQINVTGSPGQAFSLHLQGWTQVSGQAGATAASNSFYQPGGPATADGVFNASGRATIYVGSTITVPRNNPGTTVVLRPVFTVTYN
ncbi:MAG: hypothetical protein ACXWK0_15475, partial [Caulobacteraceae bacterium]